MKRWQIIVGIGLIFLGMMALLEVLTGIDLWRFVFPLVLIGFGIFLILKISSSSRDIQMHMPILGDVHKKGAWEVGHHEIWLLVGSTRLDFTDAVFSEEGAKIKLFGFVNDLKVVLPDDVGLRLSGWAFVSEFKGSKGREEKFLSALQYETENYYEVEKHVQIQAFGFVSEVKIKSSLV